MIDTNKLFRERVAYLEQQNLIYSNPRRDLRDGSGRVIVCPRCTGILSYGYRCVQCSSLDGSRTDALRADRVLPLTYADKSGQMYTDMINYKNTYLPDRVRQNSAGRLNGLVWWLTTRHWRCLCVSAQAPITAITTVPSSTPGAREEGHPLERLAQHMPSGIPRIVTQRGRQLSKHQAPEPTSLIPLTGEGKDLVQGGHVLVLEDSWVTGQAAESSAMALKQAGAAQVTIVAIARVVSPGFGLYDLFKNATRDSAWDAGLCPVTGGECP